MNRHLTAERKATRAAWIDAAVAVLLCLILSTLLNALFALPARRSTADVSRIEPFVPSAVAAARPVATSGERAR